MPTDIKKIAKSIFNLIVRILMLPLYLIYLILRIFIEKDSVFHGFSQLFSLFPGIPGNYMRKEFYRMTLKHCDSECAICFGTVISHTDSEIGKGVYIGPNCNLGTVKLEDNVTLGSNVHILSGKRQHNFSDITIPVQDQRGIYEKVSIGSDTWIGNSSVIMANIGKKCIIGAGSVVTKEIEDYSIAAGNPARVIRKRV
jgi:acetyltransferase-like isoleucine patch superfamily enzyme